MEEDFELYGGNIGDWPVPYVNEIADSEDMATEDHAFVPSERLTSALLGNMACGETILDLNFDFMDGHASPIGLIADGPYISSPGSSGWSSDDLCIAPMELENPRFFMNLHTHQPVAQLPPTGHEQQSAPEYGDTTAINLGHSLQSAMEPPPTQPRTGSGEPSRRSRGKSQRKMTGGTRQSSEKKEKRIECQKCSKRFSTKRDLERHYRSNYPVFAKQIGLKVERIPCKYERCKATFARPDYLTKHLKNKHGG